jgi:hypothetical protein
MGCSCHTAIKNVPVVAGLAFPSRRGLPGDEALWRLRSTISKTQVTGGPSRLRKTNEECQETQVVPRGGCREFKKEEEVLSGRIGLAPGTGRWYGCGDEPSHTLPQDPGEATFTTHWTKQMPKDQM